MSGHSKWATIKRAKGKNDAERGKIFTKIGREIAVAVKSGGPDPNSNSKLRDVIAKAKQNNMPNDNITRSIKKASGELSSVNYEEIFYEGYGIGGSAIIVKCLTDNRNRTVGDVRHAFDKSGGSLGSNGCVSYLFENKGTINIEKNKNMDEDEFIMFCLDANADDVIDEEDCYTVITSPNNFSTVKQALEKSNYNVIGSQVELIPQSCIDLTPEQQESFLKLIDKLEDLDDVQEVYHNVNIVDYE